jgi:dTDP-4-amino-4,6-dideoxygalactose transaminase
MTQSPPAPRYILSDVDFDEEEERAVVEVIRSKWLSQGPRTAEFEQRFAEYSGARYALAACNCTAALHLALLAAGIGPGDEVIVPSLSFVATANSVLYVGATPVFAEIESLERPLISAETVRAVLSERTRAVIPMHYAGYPCDVAGIRALGTAKPLRVIEDSAHAVGSRVNGRMLGTLGDIGCFSFFANKNLPAGEGGMLTTDDASLFEDMKLRRSHGMTSLSWDRMKGHSFSYDVVGLGYNFRMPELTAAVGMVQLGKLDRHNRERDRVFADYRAKLAGHPKLSMPFADEAAPGARHLLPIVLAEGVDRRAFMQSLRDAGIQTSIHYPPSHRFSQYVRLAGGTAPALPLTEKYAEHVVTLPFHPGLSSSDVAAICEQVLLALG